MGSSSYIDPGEHDNVWTSEPLVLPSPTGGQHEKLHHLGAFSLYLLHAAERRVPSGTS